MKYILHDLDPEEAGALFSGIGDDWEVISAMKAYARCKGCFGCWVKSPGKCVMHDGAETLGYKLSTGEEVITVSKALYGGFSVEIKRLLDRMIPASLPFFVKRNGEMHHPSRYPKSSPKRTVCFYNAGEMTSREKELAEELMVANALNSGTGSYDVYYFDNVNEVRSLL